MNKKSVAALALSSVLFAACTVAGKVPESDSSYRYKDGAAIPVDPKIYHVAGTVVADVGSLTRQTSPGGGYVTGSNGFVSGSYFGPEFGGKGFVRLEVSDSDTSLAPAGSVVILKLTDTKGVMLMPGDVIDLKCRAQAEAIAAIYQDELFNVAEAITMELDYCRLSSPIILSAKE